MSRLASHSHLPLDNSFSTQIITTYNNKKQTFLSSSRFFFVFSLNISCSPFAKPMMQKKSNETQSPESAVRHGVTFLRQAPKNGEGSSAKRIISHMSWGAGKSWGLLLKQKGSLQGIDISHLRKFGKSSTQICHFWGDMLVSWRVDGKMERCPLRNWDFLASRVWPIKKVWAATNNIFLGLPTSFLVSNLNCNVSPPFQTTERTLIP